MLNSKHHWVSYSKNQDQEFPGSPVVRTWHSHCWGPGSTPGELRSCKPHGMAKKTKGRKKKKKEKSGPFSRESKSLKFGMREFEKIIMTK